MAALRSAVRWWRLFAILLATVVGLSAAWTGLGSGLEHNFAELRYALRSHAANTDIVVVEIDARSIAAIARWPWPRRNYAAVLSQLQKAGAASVAFDVDFSSPSNPEDDAIFAEALARVDGFVTLPTFQQAADANREDYIDSLPLPALREHALAATVSVLPDPDGAIRNAPLGEITADIPRPSLAAMIAGRDGTVGVDFPIDYAINPTSIPRFSFVDVRDGRVPPSKLRGKRVLIGATAVELGDRYAVPRFGVIPGVVIQALAAATLQQGVPARVGWKIPLLAAIFFGLLIVRLRSSLLVSIGIVFAIAVVFLVSTLASANGEEMTLVPAFAALAVIAGCCAIARVQAWLSRRRAVDDATGLPNQHALARDLRATTGAIVAMRVADYDKMLGTLGGASMTDLIVRVRDRVSVLFGGITVYRIDDRLLAWKTTDRVDQFAARHEQLRTAMRVPIDINGRRIDVAVSTGFAKVEGDDVYGIVGNATMAADIALTTGLGWHVHSTTDADSAKLELSLAGEVDEAIANGQIYPLYQPKLDLKTNHIVSVEALVRWKHPSRGMLRPDLFIPLLERSDRIAALTIHVLESAIRDLLTWQAQGHRITVAVNISAVLVESSSFVSRVKDVIHKNEIDPSTLVFEVTESAAMQSASAAGESLMKFKQLGIAISMDDYGTGQSTLSYIKKLPLDELKIDRSFVELAHENRNDAVLVRSTIDMAHELGLKVVAEGVETDECLDFLHTAGCDLVQGYLISPPVNAKAILEIIRSERSRAA